jgi:probable phosphoglycerate mutase
MLAVAAGSEQITRAMRALGALFLIGVDGVTEILLVRHADCYDGITETEDPPLSTLGREQASRLGQRIKKLVPAAVYSSPYRRAVETAKMLADDVRVDPRLVEMDLVVGDDGSLDLREAPDAVLERMRAAIDEMIENHAGERVIVVSHGAAIVAYLTDVLQLEPGRLRMLPYYTSVSTVRALGDRRMVGALGDAAHLE